MSSVCKGPIRPLAVGWASFPGPWGRGRVNAVSRYAWRMYVYSMYFRWPEVRWCKYSASKLWLWRDSMQSAWNIWTPRIPGICFFFKLIENQKRNRLFVWLPKILLLIMLVTTIPFKGAQAWDFRWQIFCIKRTHLVPWFIIWNGFEYKIRIHPDIRLNRPLCACSMYAYCYYALAQHEHIVTTR